MNEDDYPTRQERVARILEEALAAFIIEGYEDLIEDDTCCTEFFIHAE